jgi:PAS domain S-box-containing protein
MVPDRGTSSPAVGAHRGSGQGTDEELRESRRLLATLLDNLPGMAYRCRNDRDWTMEFVSEGSRALTGYTPAELVGPRAVAFGDLIVEDDRDEVWRQVQAALEARQAFQISYRLRRRDGAVAWLWERGQGIFNGSDGPVAIEGFITDITAQRKAEEAHRASEEKFEKAFHASPDAISMHEQKSGRFIDVNPGMLRLFGYTREELIGRAPLDLGIWVHEAERRQFLETLRRDRSVRDQRVSVRLKDGRIRLCEISAEAMIMGGVPHNVTVLRDITERLQTEQTLRESEEKFAKAFRATPSAIAISELKTGRIIDMNEGFERLSGYKREELIGRTGEELGFWFPPGDRERMLAELQAKGSVRAMQLQARNRRGEVRTFLTSAEVVEIGGESCLVIIGQDLTDRLRAEEALRQSEEKFAKAFRASPRPLVISEAATGRYIEVNEGFEKLLGYTREEVIGRTSTELGAWANPADRDEWTARIQREGSVRDVELTFRARDGRLGFMRCSSERIEIGGVMCFLTSLEDMTAQRRTEQALRESEERVASAFRASPDSMAIADAETNQYLEVNDGFERIFGYTRAEVLGRSPHDLKLLVNPQDGDRLRAVLRAKGRVQDEEIEVITKSGERRTILHSVEPIQVAGRKCLLRVSHDITASKRAGEALRESEKKFATAFQASPMALTIVEMATGRFIEVNPAFERISGYSREEAIGRTTLELDLWSAADRAAYVERLQRDGSVRGLQLTFRGRGGKELYMRSNAEVIVLGGLRCILTVLEDISEQRRAELHQASLEAQLRQNQKLEALGTLAGGIAHDFNNILTAIVVNQELALMDIQDSEAVRTRLDEIGLASNRAKELVRQILTFSRQQQHERVRQQLQMTIHEALSLVRASLPATIEIIQELSPEAPAVLADAGQVHQIVMNLCTNAAHAMRDKPGCLAVRLGARQLDKAACEELPPLQPGLHAVLTIADTGHGMSPEVMARIFEPFFTTKGPGEGTGLGLPMVHGIMRDHDGGIFVQSQPGVGTTFELYFPASHTADLASPIIDEPIVRGHGEAVLVVDDEPAICAAVGMMLGKLGYRAETFCDPAEALARFRAAPADFDLVLTDRTMPRVTGPQLIASIQQVRPEARALLMSGLNEPDDGTATGYDFVAKPLDISLLSQAVRRALDARAPA